MCFDIFSPDEDGKLKYLQTDMERQSERGLVPLQLLSRAPNAHANQRVQAKLRKSIETILFTF